LKRYPLLWDCLVCLKTSDGKARAGGELKVMAKGPTWVTTLVLPEEGLQLTVATHALSKAWEAIEACLHLEPIPWVECSGYARKRAKQPAPKPRKD
jgi:hypothetical protein